MNMDEYESGGRALYSEFSEAVAAVLQAAVGEHTKLRLQSVHNRAKEVPSLRAKLVKAEASPAADIGDIAKDVAGCRLVFYTNGDVYRFNQSGILSRNFEVDYERSKIHHPNKDEAEAEFFISDNWVVKLSEARCELPEYRKFKGLYCEVQIQTILNHAWAEMAHDTIYKPMAESGFGAAKVEAMRTRLRKVMQECLQPAGYAFDKIASDYEQLREGKVIFDRDALAGIRDCRDRNSLEDAIESFSNYVLPNYDDYVAAAPEIIETLTDAVVRAPSMPDVPHSVYGREYPGTKSEKVIAGVCRILESGNLLYSDPDRMFDALLLMRKKVTNDDEKKPIDDLISRFSKHDRSAWQQVGPGLQRLIVDRITALDDEEIVSAAPAITIMLREALSGTVTGTTWEAEAVVLHSGSVSVSDDLSTMRQDALLQLERLHGLLRDAGARLEVRHAMLSAGSTPSNAGYDDQLGRVILDNLTRVAKFFTKIIPELSLEEKQGIEVNLHRRYYAYHALPPGMVDNQDIAAAHKRLIEAIMSCRAMLNDDPELDPYRLLVGYDSVTNSMWEKPGFDYEKSGEERSLGIDALLETVNEDTADEWLARLERFVETRSEDMATFQGLQEFIKKLAKSKPSVLISWLPRMNDRLADWLPGMLHGLIDAGHTSQVEPLIEHWLNEGEHLSSIAWYLQFADPFRYDLLLIISAKAHAKLDERVLHNVALAAARQSSNHPEGMFDEVFLPAVSELSSRGLFGWVGGMFNWDQLALLRGLSSEQVNALLALLIDLPRLGMDGECLVAVVAQEHPQAVIDFIGRRFSQDRRTADFHYEDIPFSLYHLKEPLRAEPEKVVLAAWSWFANDPGMSQYRGGRLIAQLFPGFEDPLNSLLVNQLNKGREGIKFVLSVLRAYEGQDFLHKLLRKIVSLVPSNDDLLQVVSIVIESTGVLSGEYGHVNAQEARKELVSEWLTDEDAKVRAFATSFIKSAENQLAMERRRADQSVALRKIEYGD